MKARKGTRHWDHGADGPPPGFEAKAIDPERVFDVARWRREIGEDGARWLEGVFKDFGGQTAEALGGPQVGFNVRSPQANSAIARRTNRIKDAVDTTWGQIRGALVVGDSQGEDIDQLADRIRDVFAQARGVRARVIARTEVIGAANNASLLAAKDSGVVEGKVWLTAIDHRTRGDHIAADGQAVPVDGAFQVGGESLEYPGDVLGSAANTVNCRCSLLYERIPSDEARAAGDTGRQEVDPIGRAPEGDGAALTPKGPEASSSWVNRRIWKSEKARSRYREARRRANYVRERDLGADRIAQAAERADDLLDAGTYSSRSGKVVKGVDEAMEEIDRIHGSPAGLLDDIADDALDVMAMRGDQTLGSYSFTAKGTPEVFRISTGGAADHQAFTMAHEFGHFFDHQDFGTRAKFASQGPREGAWGKWWDAIEDSDVIQNLRAMASDPSRRIVDLPDGRRMEAPLGFVNYLLDEREIFARAYSQWIAAESGQGSVLRKGLDAMRGSTEGQVLGSQWSDESFEPIRRAFRALFKEEGLIE